MNERSALLVAIGVLLVALTAVGAAVLGPSSDRLTASEPNLATDPGIVSTTSLEATAGPASGGPTTFPGPAPLPGSTTTAPFELAAPTEQSPSTTFPGGAPTFYDPNHVVPTTRPPGSSLGPGGSLVFRAPPAPTTGTAICSAAYTVLTAYESEQRVANKDPRPTLQEVKQFMSDQFDGAANTLQAAALTQPEIALRQPLVSRLHATAGAYRTTSSLSEVFSVSPFSQLLAERGPAESAGWSQILAYLKSTCPEVLSTLP